MPRVFVPGDDIFLITPFSAASRKRLNYIEESAIGAMRDQLDGLRREGRLPPGPAIWVWPSGRTPEPIETANQQWLKQRQAHHVTVYAR